MGGRYVVVYDIPHPADHIGGYPVSSSTYVNHNCRCSGCRGAWSEYHVAYMKRHVEQRDKQRRRERLRRNAKKVQSHKRR